MGTYTIQVSDEQNANAQSDRSGLWTDAPGEATGWGLTRARKAARAAVRAGWGASARLVCEQTGEKIAV